tara:strand:- start:6901 stop:7626 length:726 start_codon:yes stop_codon:yes gene_type:complete
MKYQTHSYIISGMTCASCVNKVKTNLEQHPEIALAEIFLKKNMVTLTMNKQIKTDDLQSLFGKDSKYTIKSLLKSDFEKKEKSVLKTYKPLLIIFLFITLISGIGSINKSQIEIMQWMNYFMAGFFIVFSFFKFLDLEGFTNSYSKYDLIAKKSKIYGFIYPFIELALGIAYLKNFEPLTIYIVTIVVMGISTIGVIKSVLEKKKVRCACLGAFFDLPMSTITIIEDLLMIVMASIMIWII